MNILTEEQALNIVNDYLTEFGFNGNVTKNNIEFITGLETLNRGITRYDVKSIYKGLGNILIIELIRNILLYRYRSSINRQQKKRYSDAYTDTSKELIRNIIRKIIERNLYPSIDLNNTLPINI